MKLTVRCRCRFDITATGVKHNFNRARLPFRDNVGTIIDSEGAWHRGRDRQRNWETLLQIISLRTLPVEVTEPKISTDTPDKCWQFEFVIEQPGSLETEGNPIGMLFKDSEGVPMHTGLDETNVTSNCLIVSGSDANIFFSII